MLNNVWHHYLWSILNVVLASPLLTLPPALLSPITIKHKVLYQLIRAKLCFLKGANRVLYESPSSFPPKREPPFIFTWGRFNIYFFGKLSYFWDDGEFILGRDVKRTRKRWEEGDSWFLCSEPFLSMFLCLVLIWLVRVLSNSWNSFSSMTFSCCFCAVFTFFNYISAVRGFKCETTYDFSSNFCLGMT